MSDRRPIKSFPEIFRQQGWEEGRQEARREYLLRVAHSLLRETALSDEEVACITDLALERVAELLREAEC